MRSICAPMLMRNFNRIGFALPKYAVIFLWVSDKLVLAFRSQTFHHHPRWHCARTVGGFFPCVGLPLVLAPDLVDDLGSPVFFESSSRYTYPIEWPVQSDEQHTVLLAKEAGNQTIQTHNHKPVLSLRKHLWNLKQKQQHDCKGQTT